MIEIRTPCRLHFGLLSLGQPGERQYGGVGLMVHKPDLAIRVAPAPTFSATGRLADKAVAFAERFARRAVEQGFAPRVDPVSIDVIRCPRAHCGLGTGTQLGMSVARAMAEVIGRGDLDTADLARLVGRGDRSAIGAHGFFHGGFIVEGGKLDADSLSPMLLSQPFPEAWRVVLVSPHRLDGIADERERKAFASLPAIPLDVTAEMSRLVLLGLVPALVERDVTRFGETLYELQQQVGRCFSAAQGGIFADPLLTRIAQAVREQGITGVGQSSWGPSMYAVVADEAQAEGLATDLRLRFELSTDEVFITAADNDGAIVRKDPPRPRRPRDPAGVRGEAV